MLSPPPHQSPSPVEQVEDNYASSVEQVDDNYASPVEQVDDNYDTIKAHYDVITPHQSENSEYASSVSETPQFSHQVNLESVLDYKQSLASFGPFFLPKAT